MNAFPHNHNGILYDAHYANDGLGAGKLKLLEEKNYLAVSPKLICQNESKYFVAKTVLDTAFKLYSYLYSHDLFLSHYF